MASYASAIVFVGFTLASVLAAAIYVAVEGVTSAERADPRRLGTRALMTSLVVAAILIGLDLASLGGLRGVAVR